MATTKAKHRGNPPYGYRKNEKGNLIQDRNEISTYKRIVSMCLRGLSMRRIASTLVNDKTLTCKGNEKWSPAVIAQILRNPVYYSGQLQRRSKTIGVTVTFKCKPVITRERWDEIQIRLDSALKKGAGPRVGANTFLLYDKLECGHCGRKLSCMRKEHRRYYYCYWQHCSNAELDSHKHKRCKLPIIPADKLEGEVYKLLQLYLCGEPHFGAYLIYPDEIQKAIDPKHWNDEIKKVDGKIRELERKRGEVTKLIRKINESLKHGQADLDECNSLLDTALGKSKIIEGKLQELRAEHERYQKKRENTNLLLKFHEDRPDTLMKIHQTLLTLPFEKQQSFIRGMLPDKQKVIVWVPKEDLSFNDDRPADNWTEGKDESGVKYYSYPAEKITWTIALPPEWTFDPKSLREFLGEEMNS